MPAKISITTIVAIGALALLGTVARSAEPPPAVDLSHTTASFSVKHLTLTTVTGNVAAKDVKLAVGADHVPTSVVADFDLKTIDTREAQRDDDLRSERWFDVAKYPEMTFKSTKITGDPKAITIAGELSIHGITKPVTLAAKYEGVVTDGRGRTHSGYTATTTFDRTQWGIGTSFPPVVVGNDITVTIQLEAIAAGA